MKKLAWFFVVSFLFVFGQSQNFQCINNNSISYFEDENSIKVIQIDSVIAEGDDLVTIILHLGKLMKSIVMTL